MEPKDILYNGTKAAFDDIAEDVFKERMRQIQKWGKKSHTPIEWLPILMEEVGEVAKEVHDNYYCKDFPEQIKTTGLTNYRKELIQVAAVVFSMLENLQQK